MLSPVDILFPLGGIIRSLVNGRNAEKLATIHATEKIVITGITMCGLLYGASKIMSNVGTLAKDGCDVKAEASKDRLRINVKHVNSR